MPKKIDPALKERAVRLMREHGAEYSSRSAAAVVIARQLGVGKESVRRWAEQADIDAGARPGVTTEESVEIKRLKAENRRLREGVDILRAATTFFVSVPGSEPARRGSLVSSLPRPQAGGSSSDVRPRRAP